MRYLNSLAFWITLVTCIFDTDPLHGFSQNEAVARCEQRLSSVEVEGQRLSGPYQLVFLQGIQDIKKMISDLRTTSNLTNVYRLSSECHSALRSMEWLANRYGNANQTIISPVVHQSSSVVQPGINQKASQSIVKNIVSPKETPKYHKRSALKKIVIKKKKVKRAGKFVKA